MSMVDPYLDRQQKLAALQQLDDQNDRLVEQLQTRQQVEEHSQRH